MKKSLPIQKLEQTAPSSFHCFCMLLLMTSLLISSGKVESQVIKTNYTGSNVGITVADCIYTNDPAGMNYIDPLPGALIYYSSNEQDGSASRAFIANGTHVYNPNPQTITFQSSPNQNYLYLTAIAVDSLYPYLSYYGPQGHYSVNINSQTFTIDSTQIRLFVKGNIKRALKIPYTGSQVNIEVWGNIHTTDIDSLHWDPLPGLVVYGISNGQDGSDGFAKVFEGTHPWKQQADQFSFTSNSNTYELVVFPLHDTCTDQNHPYEGQYHIKVNNIEYIVGPERIIHLLCDTCSPQYVVEQPGPAPVLYMPFTGNADDLSGNNNHGNISGAEFTNDRFDRCNSALFFDGLNDKIDVNPSPSLNLSQWTISCWVKPTATPNGYNVILGKNENYNNKYNYTLQIDPLFKVSGGFEKCTSEYDHLIFSNAIPLNEWSFIAYTRSNSGEMKLYVNGTLAASGNSTDQPCLDSQTPFMIGATAGFNWAECCYFKGGIDDIRIYDSPLNNQQIINIFNEIPEPQDTTQITCPGDTTIYTGSDNCYGTMPGFAFEEIISQFEPYYNLTGATEASYLSSIENIPLSLGITTIQASFYYNCAMATCEFKVTVMDTIKPSGQFINLTKTLQSGIASVMPSEVTDWVYDNCQVSNVSLSKSVFNCGDIGSNQVTVTVEDSQGNIVPYEINIEIQGLVPEAEIVVSPVQTIPNGFQNTIYLGYGTQSLTLISGNTGSNTWGPAGTIPCVGCDMITINPSQSTTYTLTIFNEYGCIDSTSVDICVIDPRQYINGAPGNKFLLCHNIINNPHTIAVPYPAVMPHLLQGDYLGYCGISCDEVKSSPLFPDETKSGFTPKLQISPNPFSTSAVIYINQLPANEEVTIKVFNTCGRQVTCMNLPVEDINNMNIGSDFPAGCYLVSLEGNTISFRMKIIKTGE